MSVKIFVSAYACEPGLGSEIGVGWHWILEMSRWAELWVLTRESNRQTIEPWIAQHPEHANIHFLYYDWPKWARFWKKGLRGVRTYYNLWQLSVNRLIRKTMKQNDIHRFHHLTYGNVLWPVSRYGSRQNFVWGPVGGLETIPAGFSRHFSLKSRILESVRRALVALTPCNLGFRNRCRRADVILCKTEITRSYIPAKYRHKAVIQTDVATEPQDIPTLSVDETDKLSSGPLKLITVGRLDGWRGFDIAIEALASAIKKGVNAHLYIVGKGIDGARLKNLVTEKGLDEAVTFTGKVSGDEYMRLMRECDAVVNASLKEGAVTVSFDAMALGKPLICVDTTGYTRYFTDDYAVITPLTTRKEVIEGLAQGIIRVSDYDERFRMGKAAMEAASNFTWLARGEEIKNRYNSSSPE